MQQRTSVTRDTGTGEAATTAWPPSCNDSGRVKQRALIASRASSVLHDVAYLAGRDRAFPFHSFLYTYSVPPGTSYLLLLPTLTSTSCVRQPAGLIGTKLYFASLSDTAKRPTCNAVKTYGYGAKAALPRLVAPTRFFTVLEGRLSRLREIFKGK